MIGEHFEALQKLAILPHASRAHAKATIRKFAARIRSARRAVFQGLPVPRKSVSRLNKICEALLCRDIFPPRVSGIVVAGFGEKDIFPSLVSLLVEAVVNNRLKYKEGEGAEIHTGNGAAMLAFAQHAQTATFMEGVDPSYRQEQMGYLSELFSKYPEYIVEGIPNLSSKGQKRLSTKLKRAGEQLLQQFDKNMADYTREYHTGPVINAVAVLPKDELAAMAESLVHVTSLKLRVSMEAETVGGPIDVALISKRDGFVWIRRKHYFSPELNPFFLANYFREDDNRPRRKR